MTSGTRAAGAVLLCAALAGGCASAPPPAPIEPTRTLADFTARRLDQQLAGLPPAHSGWDRAQWLSAALQLNPELSEQRAAVAAVAAGERTAAERPNPTMDLFAEYLTTVAQSSAWLYGLSLEFLLRQPGERDRLRRHAALETALAESDLADSIWQVRAALRLALLDAVAGEDESALLTELVEERQALISSDQLRLEAGDIARPQLLTDQLELTRAEQRSQQARARALEARARLAAAVGVPMAALEGVPLRWQEWAAIDALSVDTPERWRSDALIGRPQIVHALREYDLAEVSLQSEVARRWPQLRITPAYAWGGDGVQQDALNDIAHESAVAVSFELPLFNQHQGAIGEAVARRTAAGERLKAVQAAIFAQIDRAELAWPPAREAWTQTRQAAELTARARGAEERALQAGASDRASVLAARIADTEAQLALLDAAYAAQLAFGSLEDAYRRPLAGEEEPWPQPGAPHS